jgi:ABC-type branched-subunit amino acid transport system substrate-binding protein
MMALRKTPHPERSAAQSKDAQPISSRLIRAVVGATLLSAAAAGAAEPVEIHVIATMTGNAAFVGHYMQMNLAAQEGAVNADGGIQGRPLKFVFDDDQSQPQVAVQLATEAIATHPAALLVTGPVAQLRRGDAADQGRRPGDVVPVAGASSGGGELCVLGRPLVL